MKKTTAAGKTQTSLCPCHSQRPYADCCARWHGGEAAPDAVTLMRSRYSAYALSLTNYLRDTWHASTRPSPQDLAADPPCQWLGLEIRRNVSTADNSALVEFIARCKTGGRARRLHEISRFIREYDRWYYVDGEFPAASLPPAKKPR